AHVTMLRRTGVGTHDDAGMVDTAMLEAAAEHGPEALDAYLAPVSTALAHWRCVHLDAAQAAAVTNGQAVSADPADAQPGLVRIMDAVDGFLGIGEISCDGQLQPDACSRVHCAEAVSRHDFTCFQWCGKIIIIRLHEIFLFAGLMQTSPVPERCGAVSRVVRAPAS